MIDVLRCTGCMHVISGAPEGFITAIVLSDPEDRHVVAVAIRAGADGIVTNNLKDVPKDTMLEFGMEAIHPDDFLLAQFHLNTGVFINAVKKMRLRLKKPTKTASELTSFDLFK